MSAVLRALKKAKGLGSGHNGTHHFISQRVSGVILIPLVLYFLCSIISLVAAKGHIEVSRWFTNPINSAMVLAFVLMGFYHASLGGQVVIEDYVHCKKTKWLSLIVVRGVCIIFASIAFASIIRLIRVGLI